MIIGLAGRARSGKDTVADYLENLTDGTVERDAFADRLKLIAAKTLGVTFHPDDVGTEAVRRWADHLKQNSEIVVLGPSGNVEAKLTGRKFLQRLGAEGIRDCLDSDVLVDAVPMERDCDLLILTDVRFPNEAEAVRAAGGQVWEITRPGTVADSHASEQRLDRDLVDHVIENDGSLDDLRDRVRELLGD